MSMSREGRGKWGKGGTGARRDLKRARGHTQNANKMFFFVLLVLSLIYRMQ